MQYTTFSYYYDRFMDDVDYDAWLDNINLLLKSKYKINLNNNNKRLKILDVACGTGNISMLLHGFGCEVVAVDVSSDMLSVAQQKANLTGSKITFLEQDMTKLDAGNNFDVVLCVCDGVNYLYEESDIQAFFSRVYESLENNSVFVFDISSEYKLSKILANNFFADETDEATLLWQNSWDEEENIMQMDLTLFTQIKTDSNQDLCNNLYEKHTETHFQKAHSKTNIINMLKLCGFSEIICVDFDNSLDEFKVLDTSERIHFFCSKA